jgi:hypothetical protein
MRDGAGPPNELQLGFFCKAIDGFMDVFGL